MVPDQQLRLTQERRVLEFAQCLFALNRTAKVDGAAGTFDQALTNALTAIVADTWPGEEHHRGRILSAAHLLNVIEANGVAVGNGVVAVPHHPRHDPPQGQVQPPWHDSPEPLPNVTEVEVLRLREGIRVTQPVRHAHGIAPEHDAALNAEHVRALSALEQHPIMTSAMTDFLQDRHYDIDQAADRDEQLRALSYLQVIGEEEEARRAAVDWLAERLVTPGEDFILEPGECPVCGNDSIIPDCNDTWGEQVVAGHCGVCSYRRSREVADHEAAARMLARAVAKDG